MLTLFPQLSKEKMYRAIVEKDAGFDGQFFTAVKTTGIFCRPSCTARKPREENVEFFNTSKECILKGYRPCKICKPLEHPNSTPQNISRLMQDIADDPSVKIKDADLIERGLEPNAVRRWFLKNHGITFQAFQRMYRINSAFKKIKNGENVSGAAYESGFESISGFTDSFRNIFGVSPKNSKSLNIINLKRFETPLGTMYACAVDQGICLLEFTDRKMLETEFKDLAKRLNATIIQGEHEHFTLLEKELIAYFNGTLVKFTVPLFYPGTPFQQNVWEQLKLIPYGETRTYAQLAGTMGNTAAVRAVANANGMNRIAIIIPCHRVIGSNGELTGYAGGLWRKQQLLDLESTKK